MEEPDDGIQLSGFFHLNPAELVSGASSRGAVSGGLGLAIR